MKIEVKQSIYDKNDRIAAETKEALSKQGVFAVNVMGAPGCGKTTVIRGVVGRLNQNCCVVEGDIESDIDTAALKKLGIEAVQINTHGACHLDAPVIQSALADIRLKEGVLFIENIGNLVCPAEFTIGEHAKMLIVTAADGSDKPYKYPLAFEKADIIVINKADLMPYVDFDMDFFMRGVRALNRAAGVFTVSAKTGEGMDEVVQWIREKRLKL